MAIVGLGTDIIEIARIEQSLTRSPRLVQRVLTESEQQILAARWSASAIFCQTFCCQRSCSKSPWHRHRPWYFLSTF